MKLVHVLTALCAACSILAAPTKTKGKSKTPVAPSTAPSPIPPAGAPGELLDLTTGRSLAIGPMLETRVEHQATLLPDGRVLITGGSLKDGSTEYFDPSTRTFKAGPTMAQTRQGHSALLLSIGGLLVAGGTDSPAPAELLEKGTTSFAALPGDARFGLSAALVELEDGNVLLCDGMSGKCWLWDPKTKNPKSVGSLSIPRILFKALRLKDGRVLVSGGWPAPTEPRPVRAGWPQRKVSPSTPSPVLPVECFDPKRRKWSTWKATLSARARHNAALLADGRVCLFGGFGTDANQGNESLEVLDPAKEYVSNIGTLSLKGQSSPGWCPKGERYLALLEGQNDLREVTDPAALVQAQGSAAGIMANSYLNPILVPILDNKVLVLGSPAWGSALERWDPRGRLCIYVGALRSGTETMGILPDGKVIAVGPVIDQVDLKTGNLTPLGWRDALSTTIKKAALYPVNSAPPAPPFPQGEALRDYLVIPLDKGKAMVVGGVPADGQDPLDTLWLWDLKKKNLSPCGTMKAKRSFPSPSRPGEGALALKDGSVLIWSTK